ncbi:MAG: mevalonate kinase [Candidatus Micrarchaeia archaeon]
MESKKVAVAYAPAAAKLFGEHAAIYGELSLGAALNMYAYSHVESIKGHPDYFELSLQDLELDLKRRAVEIEAFYSAYQYHGLESFTKMFNGKPLPYLTIAAQLESIYGVDISGIKASIRSNIPLGKGLASSAACFTAFTISLVNYFSLNLDDNKIMEIARTGERIAHRNKSAGMIDVSTIYYGGYVSYSKNTGVNQHDLPPGNFLIIDTGPKKSTAETVGHVSELYAKEKDKVSAILSEIGKCSKEGLSALSKGDYELVGQHMLENHRLLGEIGVSTPSLDAAVDLAVKKGAFGAKLSGGGGGGIIIAIAPEDKIPAITEAFRNIGMPIYNTTVAPKGAKSSLGNVIKLVENERTKSLL